MQNLLLEHIYFLKFFNILCFQAIEVEEKEYVKKNLKNIVKIDIKIIILADRNNDTNNYLFINSFNIFTKLFNNGKCSIQK